MGHEADADAIDATLADWQQGDLLLSAEVPVVRLADMARPLTPVAIELAEGSEGLNVVAEDVAGLMIISQTCDVVRACIDRPFLQVCPLVTVEADVLEQTRRGLRPRFLHVSGLEGTGMVADLEQVMTVEKAVLLRVAGTHRAGAQTEDEVRAVGRALANKLARAAFPDAFAIAAERLRTEIVRKHGKTSPMGAFLRGLLEIRVRAHPNWSAAEAEIEFVFVFERSSQIPPGADDQAHALLGRFQKSDAYPDVTARVVGLDQLTALTYRETDRLDLDHLSAPARPSSAS